MTDVEAIASNLDRRLEELLADDLTDVEFNRRFDEIWSEALDVYESLPPTVLFDLPDGYPHFRRIISAAETAQVMAEALQPGGSHPFADLPQIPERLKPLVIEVISEGVALENAYFAMRDKIPTGITKRVETAAITWARKVSDVLAMINDLELPPKLQIMLLKPVMSVAIVAMEIAYSDAN